MKQDYKILTQLDTIIDSYKEPIKLIDGLNRSPKDIIRRIEFYTNDKYLSGNYDELGREKPFFQICNFRVTVAKTATDIDVKDIKYEPETLDDAIPAMLVNHELFKYLKESDFSETLNDMGKTRPKYGGLLVKKCIEEDELEIEVVDWKNVDFNPACIEDGVIIETHYLQPSEVASKADVWENVEELLKAHAKYNKNKPAPIEIKEITGEFDTTFDPDIKDTLANEMEFKKMCFYIGVVNKKKFYLYKEDLKKEEDKYKYLAWEKIGDGLGRGVVEDGFESQWATNDAMLSIKNIMDISGKVVLSTDSNKISGNVINGVDNGHIFQIEPGRSLTSVNLAPSNLPEFHNVIELWRQQYDNSVSVHDANTGEAPTAGTPYSQTALLNQVANSPFEYQREVWGIFVNELLEDWILPHIKARILKKHYLVSEFGDDELKMIDEAIYNTNLNQFKIESILQGNIPNPTDITNAQGVIANKLSNFGNKREIEIPKGYLDIEGRITCNITGELKNKQAILASLAQIGKDIASTFNPQTGQFGAMENPFLKKLYGTIINLAGTPITSGDLNMNKTNQPSTSPQAPTQPTQQPDMSAIAPATAQPAMAG
jgi:hypothetical protein